MSKTWIALGMAVFTMASASGTFADDASGSVASTQPAAAGILPVPDYSGDLWHRAYITGDWGGTRADLAEKGLQFDMNFTQIFQSVVDGGRDHGSRYDGHFNYQGKIDLMKMGVLPGALIQFRAESRFGESVNDIAGPILPVNTSSFEPITVPQDQDVPITVTSLNYTQFLGPQFGVMVGKFETFSGDPNPFASGRGVSQFFNMNLIASPSIALSVPYSTVGGGIIVLPCKWVTVSSLVFTTKDSSTTSGFQNIGDGWTSSTEADTQYRLFGLHGGVNVGGTYAWDEDFTQINGRFVFQKGVGLVIPKRDTTWAVYVSGWQYLWEKDPREGPVNLQAGEPDREGLGLFTRISFADEETNPVKWSASVGVGGRGLVPTRGGDTWGAGYHHIRLQDTRIGGLLNIGENTDGFEAFYNLAVTPACHLTFDVQVVDTALPRVDTAVILGLRLDLRF